MNKIGTYKESSLHRSLKFRYSDSGQTEIGVDSFVCDGKSKRGELIEVQTGSFGPIKEKIISLTKKKKKIRLIYPIIKNKYIELYDTEDNLLRKRKSPGKGSIWDLFNALLYAPDLCLTPYLKLELVILDIIEKRKNDGKGGWRRKGVTIEDKIPVAWYESIILSKPRDYNLFIPFGMNENFTVNDLGEKAKITKVLARKCVYVLHKNGLIERIGKQGNSHVYRKIIGR